MKTKLNKCTALFLLPILFFAGCKEKTEMIIISEKDFESKLNAAWIGQMVGVGWAAPTEFKWIGEIIPEDKIPAWKPEMINQFGQDDLYVEMNFMKTLEEHGIEVSIRDAGINFANTGFGLAAANDRARENLRQGIAPPASGHPRFNVNCEDIDYQIEADFSGIIAPGMLQSPIYFGELFGKIMNYGDGMYAGQFIGGMYSTAYFENDVKTIINKGLACIPDSSLYAACIKDVIGWYHENPVDWQGTWSKIVDKYYNTLDNQPFHNANPKAWAGIDAKLNGAFVVLGLLYGNGDIDSTFYISARAGFDSDCNPSSALGILFTAKGMENIPAHFYSALDTTICFANTEYSFPKLIEASKELTRNILKQYGGKIKNGKDGESYLLIKKQPPIPSKLVQSWNPQELDEENIYFTESEFSKIKYLPSSAFNTILEVFAPGWKIYNATKDASPELIFYREKENVLQMSFLEGSKCNMRHEFLVPDVPNPVIRMNITDEPGRSWKFRMLLSWKPIYETEVNDNLTNGGWYEVVYDLSEYRGKYVFILIQGEATNDMADNSKVLLSNLSVE